MTAFSPLLFCETVVEYTTMKNCRVSINAVKPVNDIKFKTQVGWKAIPQEKPSLIMRSK